MTLIITALKEAGMRDTASCITAIRSWDTLTILVKNSPFNQTEVKDILVFLWVFPSLWALRFLEKETP